MNDIEAIALALCLADDPDQIGTTGSCEGGCVHPAVGSVCPYDKQARAALQCIIERWREPTAEMIGEAGASVLNKSAGLNHRSPDSGGRE